MTPLLTYLIKSSVSLALLYCLFRLTVRNDKNHRLTRFLLLSIMVVSAAIPFLTVQLFYKEIEIASADIVREIVSTPIITQPENYSAIIHSPVAEQSRSVNYWTIIYAAIISLLLFRLLLGIYLVSTIIKNAEKHRFRKIVLAVVKDFIQPFTFLNRVVLSEKDFQENRAIVVAHEYAHIRHKHAVDLLFCELFTAVHFFNPFMWLLRRDLKLVHEYQADEAVLKTGIDAQKYQLLVLEKAVGERRFAMAHHFTQKPIVKRLKMMTKTKRRKWGTVKMILFVPLIIVLLQAFARPDLITKSADFIPVRYTENKAEQWLAKWNIDNIGGGVFQPFGLKMSDNLAKHNRLVIQLNSNNDYYFENEAVSRESLKQEVKNFITGVHKEEGVLKVDNEKVDKRMLSFAYDKESLPEAREFALSLIGEVYLEIRQQKANDLFRQDYFDLDVEKREIIDELVPILFGYSSVHVYNPEPPPPIRILMVRNGNIRVGDIDYNLVDFESAFKENFSKTKAVFDKYGHEFELSVEIRTEDGVSEKDVQTLEHFLKKVGTKRVSAERIE